MTPRDRLALSLGGGMVLLAVLGLRVVPAVADRVNRSRSRLEERRTLLAETNAAIRGLSAMEDSARSLTGQVVALAPRLLVGPTASAALSDLSGQLTMLALRHHAQLVSLEAVPDSTTAGSLQRLTASAVMNTDFRSLAELLAVLARDPVALRADRIQVTPADPYASAAQPEQLHVELRLTGWYLAAAVHS
ncbi:MAG: GspMb/PilO family protein [Gemmatimonadota bacterium]